MLQCIMGGKKWTDSPPQAVRPPVSLIPPACEAPGCPSQRAVCGCDDDDDGGGGVDDDGLVAAELHDVPDILSPVMSAIKGTQHFPEIFQLYSIHPV